MDPSNTTETPINTTDTQKDIYVYLFYENFETNYLLMLFMVLNKLFISSIQEIILINWLKSNN